MERADSLWVSLLGLGFSYLHQSLFPNVSTPVQGLRCACSAPRGVSLPKNVTRREARHVCNEWMQARRQMRRVDGNTELACPPTTDVGRSLPDTLALADRNTLHSFQVSLKRRKESLPVHPWLLRVSSFLPIFVSTTLVLGECGHTCVANGADPGTGGGGCHGASVCS
jgi:hypothetical protein